MSTAPVTTTHSLHVAAPACPSGAERAALTACFFGMFVVTLDAVIVNVALPHIQADLGGGMTGTQWIVDGYTLMFAALLLPAGAISDRIGARRALAIGVALFVMASAACGLAPSLTTLVAARFAQGASAALVMPASMSLIRQAFPDPRPRAHAVGMWALGGAVASSAGPVLGGFLTLVDWRLIFAVNVPVGVATVMLLRRAPKSPRQHRPYDRIGQLLAITGMSGLTYAAIESGSQGLTALPVLAAAVVAVVALLGFIRVETRSAHPMMPLSLFRSRTVSAVVLVGAAFMVCYYGMPFVVALDLQQARGLSSLATGLTFVPMMVVGLVLTPFSARIVEAIGGRRAVTAGLLLMSVGLLGIALAPRGTPVWVLSALMLLVGVGGPTVMPPATAALLSAVPATLAGTASGVLNTSRQLGGALAVAVFGALLSGAATFQAGMRASLIIAAVVAVTAAGAAALLLPADRRTRATARGIP